MDRRSWLWRRKSPEKSPGETESSGSASSHSERLSDEQEAPRASPNNSSTNHAQSPGVSSDISEDEVHETVKSSTEKLSAVHPNNASPNHVESPEVSSSISYNGVHETIKSLTEKLSTALSNLSAKEDLVKQHTKVAEEAVSGWEQAETEVSTLKQQLEAAAEKNSALEDRISHLEGALKECVRQLRQSREEQEEKIHDALVKKTQEWELGKSELENQLLELKVQLDAAKAEAATSVDHGFPAKLEAAERENMALKVELLAQSEDVQVLMLERELSSQAAETASKQHLESIKKVTKLEAECHRLRSLARRSLPVNDHKRIANSVCVESLTDSQSDSGDRLLTMDNEPGCSDSWASALIAELDQFKNDKASARHLITSSVGIDLMDDFLEMEKLAALPEADHASSSFELEADPDRVFRRDSPSKAEDVHQRLAELEERVTKLEAEKTELEVSLADVRNQHETSCSQLRIADDKLVELQRQLDLANDLNQEAAMEVVSLEAKRTALECQLESAQLEVGKLCEKVCLLEGEMEFGRALSAEFTARIEAAEVARKAMESQLESALMEAGGLREMVSLLEGKVEEERALSAKFTAKIEAVEGSKHTLESQLELTHLEVGKLHEKLGFLEMKAVEEREASAEFSAKIEAVEAARKALDTQLEAAHLEIGKLHDKVSLLEGKLDKERALSAEFATKCQKLENELSCNKRESEVWQITSSNGDLKVKQEKELTLAAGKLAECQKTIASLSQQLKSLTILDEYMLESEKPALNGGLPDLIDGDAKALRSSDFSQQSSNSALLNNKERGPSLSSSSSTLSGFTKLLSRSRSSSRTET